MPDLGISELLLGAAATAGTGATSGLIGTAGALTLGGAASLGSLALTGISAISGASAASAAGESQQKMLDYEANQANTNAGQQRAASERKAIEQDRLGNIAISNAKAAAGAGGGSLDDPTIQNIEGKISDESSYRKLTALYEGEDAARGLETQANLKTFEGENDVTAGGIKATNSLISGVAGFLGNKNTLSLLQKYG